MSATASTNPFAGVTLNYRTLGKGKKRRVEAWITLDANRQWRDPKFADLRGLGRNLDAASLDLTKKGLHLMEELGIIASTSPTVTFKMDATACASTGGLYTIRL